VVGALFVVIDGHGGREPAMLLELAVVEQRFQAVREVLDGAPVTVVARRFGVARQTVHEWLHRYAADGGLANLADRESPRRVRRLDFDGNYATSLLSRLQ
jgi:transposase-like protein